MPLTCFSLKWKLCFSYIFSSLDVQLSLRSVASSIASQTSSMPCFVERPKRSFFLNADNAEGIPFLPLPFYHSPAQEAPLSLLTDTGFNSSVTIIIKDLQQWSLCPSSSFLIFKVSFHVIILLEYGFRTLR